MPLEDELFSSKGVFYAFSQSPIPNYLIPISVIFTKPFKLLYLLFIYSLYPSIKSERLCSLSFLIFAEHTAPMLNFQGKNYAKKV